MGSILRLYRVAGGHWFWLLLALTSMVIVAAMTVFALNLARPIFDLVLQPVSAATADRIPVSSGLVGALDVVVERAVEELRSWVGDSRTAVLALALLAVVLKNVFAFVSRIATARLGLATVRDLRNRLFEALLAQSPGYLMATPTAVMVSRVTNDVDLVREAVAERIGDLFQDCLTVVVLAVNFMGVVFTGDPTILLEYGAGIALPIAALALFVGLRTWSTHLTRTRISSHTSDLPGAGIEEGQ